MEKIEQTLHLKFLMITLIKKEFQLKKFLIYLIAF